MFEDDPEPRGKLRGSMLEFDVGQEIADDIVETVRKNIIGKVEKELCYETKYNALTALADIGLTVVSCDRGELSSPSQSGDVPVILIKGMWTITRMMSPEEIQQVMVETDAPTRQFAADRFAERKALREKQAENAKRAHSKVKSPRGRRGYGHPSHDEVLDIKADKFIAKLLRLRWADNPNSYERRSWNGLDAIVDFFTGLSKSMDEE